HAILVYTSQDPLLRSTFHHITSLFIFSPLLHPPPKSTLFPYTTLFRSQKKGQSQHGEPPVTAWLRVLSEPAYSCNSSIVSGFSEDRKSTRLNSSHDQISYAVFCLKKKNKI